MKNIFAIRMHLGDERFLNLTTLLDDIRSEEFIQSIVESISENTTFPSGDHYGGIYSPIYSEIVEDHGTTHVSIMDGDGNAVAMTSTINTAFGSFVISEQTGILLNNEMDDFSVGTHANKYGIAPSEANFIEPGKKPLSSTSPTIIEKDGKPVMVVGASGGPRIITGVLQLILRLLNDEELGSAVARAQIHHQLYPENIRVEDKKVGNISYQLDPSIIEGLKTKNHDIVTDSFASNRQVILVDDQDGSMSGASDPRKDGAPSGF
eukprot:TRINITY_DN14007_c0_g1_i3.p1 TRINITY_DN14007_c0_g1~~TRINITY_DN14007_c0_g1_i3.p1  ORF type:complete len:264 (-),score=36.29 TRINITY_DN14007_c0_g1_i3:276-1067(-)